MNTESICASIRQVRAQLSPAEAGFVLDEIARELTRERQANDVDCEAFERPFVERHWHDGALRVGGEPDPAKEEL